MSVFFYIMYQDLVFSKRQSLDFLFPKSKNQLKKISYDMRAIDFARKYIFPLSTALFSLVTRSGE